MATKVGIFGGSFNPVHNGHIALAEALVRQGVVDEVWLTLSPLNPLKAESTELVSDADRLAMLRLATANSPGLKVCDIELSLPRPSYTISTLHALSRLYPDISFRLIIGADNRLIFHKWKDYGEIDQLYAPIVYPRPGYPCAEALDMEVHDISSTEIRRKFQSSQPDMTELNNLLPQGVTDYIREHRLYAADPMI